MCVEQCQKVITKELCRRNFLKGAVGMAALSATACASGFEGNRRQTNQKNLVAKSFTRAVDLTHTLSAQFPTYGGKSLFSKKQLTSFEKQGFNSYEWTLSEHVGTHIDAPIHFSAEKNSLAEIPVSDLVVPLAVIDIREKAALSPDTMLTPDDIKNWESKYGPIPEGACVAMNSGWDALVKTKKFRNADEKNVMHFPGFHAEAAQFLLEERNVRGIAVDTLSLDNGQSKTFPVHYSWLPSNKWGIECIANLGELPPSGATLVLGALPIPGASGGPSRVIALTSGTL